MMVTADKGDFKSDAFRERAHGERKRRERKRLKTSRGAFVPLNQSAETFAANDLIEYDPIVLRGRICA
ncbi:hypothetical protein CA54_38640 [Symmachiella macrocystis]|uniref:Uncharacterized protein n=1 Tax=Symmachiella macrocystis TaxID=2527985 RepID=A0A5C6B9J8_9PLAN|nr:hypothetical protein CA54_38640 [Symmachiella macrocystis]